MGVSDGWDAVFDRLEQMERERDEARAEVVSLRRSRKVWNKLLKGAIRQAEARGARRAAATDERGVCLGCGRLVATRQNADLSDHHPTCPVVSKARR